MEVLFELTYAEHLHLAGVKVLHTRHLFDGLAVRQLVGFSPNAVMIAARLQDDSERRLRLHKRHRSEGLREAKLALDLESLGVHNNAVRVRALIVSSCVGDTYVGAFAQPAPALGSSPSPSCMPAHIATPVTFGPCTGHRCKVPGRGGTAALLQLCCMDKVKAA